MSLLASLHFNRWDISRAGSVENQNGTSFSPGYALRYAFHFNLVDNLGLLVGTGAQASFEYKKYGAFVPGPSITLPSVTVGAVYGLTFDTRLAICGEYAALWYPWLKTSGLASSTDANTSASTPAPVEISVIPDTWGAFAQFDYFFSRTRSVTLLAGWRTLMNTCAGSCKGETLIGLMHITNRGPYIQGGITWQPGDELNTSSN